MIIIFFTRDYNVLSINFNSELKKPQNYLKYQRERSLKIGDNKKQFCRQNSIRGRAGQKKSFIWGGLKLISGPGRVYLTFAGKFDVKYSNFLITIAL